MGKDKIKPIQTDLDTFRHNRHIQEFFWHIQTYSKLSLTLEYLEPWHIQNPDIFRTRSILKILAYSESPYIPNAYICKIQGIFRTLSNIYDEAFFENS